MLRLGKNILNALPTELSSFITFLYTFTNHTMAYHNNNDLLELGSIADLDLSVSSDQLNVRDQAGTLDSDNQPDGWFVIAEL